MKEPTKEIIWYAPEFRYRDKDISWYWLTIIGAGIIFLLSLWQKNLLFAIFIFIGEGMIIFWAKEFPKNIRFRIDKRGIEIGKIKTYLYEDFDGFHLLEENEGLAELVLKTKSKLHPYVKILISPEDAPEIGSFLKNHLKEIEYEESLSDGISRMIGF